MTVAESAFQITAVPSNPHIILASQATVEQTQRAYSWIINPREGIPESNDIWTTGAESDSDTSSLAHVEVQCGPVHCDAFYGSKTGVKNPISWLSAVIREGGPHFHWGTRHKNPLN